MKIIEKVYVCTSGEYSDYHIDTVFDNKEDAEEFCEKFGDMIEEYEINVITPILRTGFKRYIVCLDRDGNTPFDSGSNIEQLKYLNIGNLKTVVHFNEGEKEKYPCSRLIPNTEYILVTCFAKNEEHALKIANEKRTEIIAFNKWSFDLFYNSNK